ncbi:MAG: hypothetical protein ACI89E_002040 [Planctomycetota bacterium]|jgi:hypothetical protein
MQGWDGVPVGGGVAGSTWVMGGVCGGLPSGSWDPVEPLESFGYQRTPALGFLSLWIGWEFRSRQATKVA